MELDSLVDASSHPPLQRVKPRRSLVAPLLTIFLLEIFGIVLLLPRDPLIAGSIQNLLHPPQRQATADNPFLAKNNPPLGSLLPSDGVGRLVRRAARPTHLAYLLVPIGDCASCIKADLTLWQQESAKRGISMVLLTTATKTHATEFCRVEHLTVPTVLDPGGVLAQRLSAAWSGRPYLFSPDWRLLWLAQDMAVDIDLFQDKGFLATLKGGIK